MPPTRWLTDNKLRRIFGGNLSVSLWCLSVVVCLFFVFNFKGNLHTNYCFQFCGFIGFLCVSICVSAHICVPCTFFVCLFILFVCFVLFGLLHLLVRFTLFYYYSLEACLFSNERQSGDWPQWEEKWKGKNWE